MTILPQVAGNLGQRLNALDQTLRAQGMECLVFIGSDAPGLDAADYAATRAALQHNDVVLIPALDGGVVLMASRCALTDVCRIAGQSVKTLGQGYDVDEPEDFVKLITLLHRVHGRH